MAELPCDLAPGAKRVVFYNSGTGAATYAMRAARVFTGRGRIGLFEGRYHGALDQALVKDDPRSPRPSPRLSVSAFPTAYGRATLDCEKIEAMLREVGVLPLPPASEESRVECHHP